MTISQALAKFVSIEDSELLLAHVLGQTKEFLLLHPEAEVTEQQFSDFSAFCERRAKGEPFAYIVGYKDFFGLKFKVNSHVLIPRPETEWLVEQGLAEIKKRSSQSFNVLDMGTGSGCIAISLAKTLQSTASEVEITATDLSPLALNIARENAQTHKVRVNFVQSDLFERLGTQKFDLILTNLPYVPQSDYEKLLPNLKFEPESALTDQTNSWELYKKFFAQAVEHLQPGGVIFAEVDPGIEHAQPAALPANAKTYNDLNGLLRFVEYRV